MKRYSPEVQEALAKIVKVKAAHEDELFKLPGVHTISVQPKTTKGIRTPEFAIVVHVAKKKPANDLAPGDVIPPIIDGVSTDVVESPRRVLSAAPSTNTDDNNYPHVIGGVQIVSDGTSRHSDHTTTWRIGTLGCVAINQDPAVTDPSKQAIALTNAHVLLDALISTTHDGSAVGQPSTSSLCCKSLDHTVGHVDHDALFTGFEPSTNPQPPPTGIDAGFITLDPGVQWSAEVIASGKGGSITTEQIAGPHVVDDTEALFDTSNPPLPIYAVHKRGVRTEATTGWLYSVDATVDVEVESLDGTVTKTLRFMHQLELQPQDPTKYFGLQGDSGSAILNSSHQVIGLLFGVPRDTDPPSTSASACPIGDVQEKLNVLVADSVRYPGLQTVPQPSAAAHAFANLPADRSIIRERMQTARAELGNTEIGQMMDEALHLHFAEIRGLVNLNKRTAAVWRRIRGPAWISEVFNCLLDRARQFPTELEGTNLNDCIDQLSAVLHRYGSQSLVRDLTRLRPELCALAGRTYNETLASWRTTVTS
ncbi:MAG TPA: hypothetical protein VK578_23100 [Edaphobacter sp.]|nr:hypothetical protein [Edaphobacter sp.]